MNLNKLISLSSSNSITDLVKLPIWIILCFFLVLTDTITILFLDDFNDTEFKSYISLIPYLLLALTLFKISRACIALLLIFILNRCFPFLNILERENSLEKRINLDLLRNFSLNSNNSLYYNYYEKLKLKNTIKETHQEIGAYFIITFWINYELNGETFKFIQKVGLENNIVSILIISTITLLVLVRNNILLRNTTISNNLPKNLITELNDYRFNKLVN